MKKVFTYILLVFLSLSGCSTFQVNKAYRHHDVAVVMYNQFGYEVKDSPVYEEYITNLNETLRILNRFLASNATDIEARIILADTFLMLGDISDQTSYYIHAQNEAVLVLETLTPNTKQLARSCYHLAQAMVGNRSEMREHYNSLKSCQPGVVVDLSVAEFQDFAKHMEILDRRFAMPK